MYTGSAVKIIELDAGSVNLQLDCQGQAVNTLGSNTLRELEAALDVLEGIAELKGVLVTSGKKGFCVGADVNEFPEHFAKSEQEIIAAGAYVNSLFNRIEDLPCPTVAVISGNALGGGFELSLATDYRVADFTAQTGLPEVKLGLMPGWGGSVRLTRLIGIDNAIEWVCSGAAKKAEQALKSGALNTVVAPKILFDSALKILRDAMDGKLEYKKAREKKVLTVCLNEAERSMAFDSAKGMIGMKAGPHYPAPLAVIGAIEAHCMLTRDKALQVESDVFARLAKTSVAQCLVSNFLKDGSMRRELKSISQGGRDVKQAAVIGAGIMGGGIAYQSASTGTNIVMKDINQAALDTGLNEVNSLLLKQIKRGKSNPEKMAKVLNRIEATLGNHAFADVDLAVEAVVENVSVKKSVLAEVESYLPEHAVLATNTSTLTISQLADSVKRADKFCGMHFFNPVYIMPLVEIIRGPKTSKETIATAVAYALKMRKVPVVVDDCAGFLVNRILFPYIDAFTKLMQSGVDFQRIDRLMEAFGWPMGPAYLMDVVGLDTGFHAAQVMSDAYPGRMKQAGNNANDLLFAVGRLGQKSGQGYYRYELDKRGKQRKLIDPTVYDIINPSVVAAEEISDQEVVERMMLPFCLEAVRCLEEGVVSTAAEVDMAVIYGVGFPAFLGGPLQYIDTLGAAHVVERCTHYRELGAVFEVPQTLLDMAEYPTTFHSLTSTH